MKARFGQYWRVGTGRDLESVRAFLAPRETWAAGCADKVRKVALPGRLSQRFLNPAMLLPDAGQAGLDSLVFFGQSGLVFPVLGSRATTDARAMAALPESPALRAGWSSRRPFSCIGRAADVDCLESVFGWKPRLEVLYNAMAQADFCRADPWIPSRLIRIRRAGISDLDALAPLAAAYDREEVLTELHRFDYEVCKAAQLNSLRHFVVYVAEYEGRLVGRAQTNASGFERDQIGGVYVEPAFRNKGIAKALMSSLLLDLNSRGRLASLFVKRNNHPAIRLYEHCGFEFVSDYRIDYY